MARKVTGDRDPILRGLIWLLADLVLFWLTALVTWVWNKAGAPWEVTLAGNLAACFSLLSILLLFVMHILNLMRELLRS